MEQLHLDVLQTSCRTPVFAKFERAEARGLMEATGEAGDFIGRC